MVMIVVWLSCSFNYFLIIYLVNTFKKVYACAMASSISEMLAYAFSGIFYEKFGVKTTFAFCFTVAVAGGLVILIYGLEH